MSIDLRDWTNSREVGAYRQTVDLVSQGFVGTEFPVVVAYVYEHLKQVGRKQLLEEPSVALHAEQKPQCPKRILLVRKKITKYLLSNSLSTLRIPK